MSRTEAEAIAIELQRAGMFRSSAGFLLAAEYIHQYDNAGKYTGKDRTTTDDVMAVAYELRLCPTQDEINQLLLKCERVWASGGTVEHLDLADYFKQVRTRPREKYDLIWWLQHGRDGEATYHQSDLYNIHSWVKGGRLYVADGLFIVSARLLPPGYPGGEPLIDVKDWQ